MLLRAEQRSFQLFSQDLLQNFQLSLLLRLHQDQIYEVQARQHVVMQDLPALYIMAQRNPI